MIVVNSSVWIDFLTPCASWPETVGESVQEPFSVTPGGRGKWSSNGMAGWVLAMHPCRYGILHAFAARFNITNGRSKAPSSEGTSRAPPARRTSAFKPSAARVPAMLRLDGSRLRDGPWHRAAGGPT